MTNAKSSPENTGDAASEGAAQELLEHRDLQDAQIDSMMHIWDNPEDERWNDVPLSVGEVIAPISSDAAARPVQLNMAQAVFQEFVPKDAPSLADDLMAARRTAADPQ